MNPHTPTKSKGSSSDDASPRSKALAINNFEKNLFLELELLEKDKLNV